MVAACVGQGNPRSTQSLAFGLWALDVELALMQGKRANEAHMERVSTFNTLLRTTIKHVKIMNDVHSPLWMELRDQWPFILPLVEYFMTQEGLDQAGICRRLGALADRLTRFQRDQKMKRAEVKEHCKLLDDLIVFFDSDDPHSYGGWL